MHNKKIAGIVLLFIVILNVGIWVVLLNVANPVDITWKDNLRELLSADNELRPWFYASFASIIFSFISAVVYFSKLSNSRLVILLLFVGCTLQAIPAIWFLSWGLKAVYVFPVIIGYLAYKNPNKSLNQIGAKNAPSG